MYGEIRKMQYLEFIKETHKLNKAKEHELNAIFEKISEIEIDRNLDIAQINPDEYPDIIYQVFDVQRFTYFRQLFYRLHQYREFVFDKGLLDIKWLFMYQTNPKSLSGEDLFDIFKELREKYDPEIIFYTPDYLCKYLEKYLYPMLLMNEEIYSSYLHDGMAIFSERLQIIYAILAYLGVKKEHRCSIPKSSFIITDDSIMFFADRRLTHYIKGYTKDLLSECLEAGSVLFLRDTAKHGIMPIYKDLNRVTFLSYFSDETPNDMIKRSNTMYNKFSRDIKDSVRKIPSLGNIEFQGIIAEICRRINSDNILNTNLNIITLFNYLTNSKLSFGDIRAYEVTREVQYRYKYMLEHNLF